MKGELDWKSFINHKFMMIPNVIMRGSAGMIPGPGYDSALLVK
jgi:hypothetical protein